MLRLIVYRAVKAMPFYAVGVGNKPGIYLTWPECQAQVNKFPDAKYKKFPTQEEAENFVKSHAKASGLKEIHTKQAYYAQRKRASSKSNGTTMVESQSDPCSFSKTNSQPASSISSQKTLQQAINQMKAAAEQMTHFLFQMKHALKNDATDYEDAENGEPSRKRAKSGDLKPTTRIAMRSVLSKIKTNNGQMRTYITQTEDILGGGVEVKEEYGNTSRNGEQKISVGDHEFETCSSGYPVVYTDGGCTNNGYPNARAGIGVYWGPDHEWNVSKRCPGRQTNNHAEIRAGIEAVKQARQAGMRNLTIRTDSAFMINCITKWIFAWKKKGWKLGTGKPVVNKEELIELDKLLGDGAIKVKWEHVPGHEGIHGNEEADRLATEGLQLPPV